MALPDVNVGYIDVDFITATRSMRGGIIKIEEIGGVAYTLTTLTPEYGGGVVVTGGVETGIHEPAVHDDGCVYDLYGRKTDGLDLPCGIYIKNGKKIMRMGKE